MKNVIGLAMASFVLCSNVFVHDSHAEECQSAQWACYYDLASHQSNRQVCFPKNPARTMGVGWRCERSAESSNSLTCLAEEFIAPPRQEGGSWPGGNSFLVHVSLDTQEASIFNRATQEFVAKLQVEVRHNVTSRNNNGETKLITLIKGERTDYPAGSRGSRSTRDSFQKYGFRLGVLEGTSVIRRSDSQISDDYRGGGLWIRIAKNAGDFVYDRYLDIRGCRQNDRP